MSLVIKTAQRYLATFIFSELMLHTSHCIHVVPMLCLVLDYLHEVIMGKLVFDHVLFHTLCCHPAFYFLATPRSCTSCFSIHRTQQWVLEIPDNFLVVVEVV